MISGGAFPRQSIQGRSVMNDTRTSPFARPPILPSRFAVALLLSTVAFGPMALADDDGRLRPNHLLVSRTVYDADKGLIVSGVTQLPPNCAAPNCVTATADATYPTVFNNDLVD